MIIWSVRILFDLRAFRTRLIWEHEHRAGRITNNHFRCAPELNVLQAGIAVGRKNDKVNRAVFRDFPLTCGRGFVMDFVFIQFRLLRSRLCRHSVKALRHRRVS